MESGVQRWEIHTTGQRGGLLETWFGNEQSVFVTSTRCFSEDRPYRPGDQVISALDAKTGHRRWALRDVAPFDVSGNPRGKILPVVDPRFFRSHGHRRAVLQGVDASSGRVTWRTPIKGMFPLALDAQTILLRSPEFVGYDSRDTVRIRALARATGATQWTMALPPGLDAVTAAIGPDVVAMAVMGTAARTCA